MDPHVFEHITIPEKLKDNLLRFVLKSDFHLQTLCTMTALYFP